MYDKWLILDSASVILNCNILLFPNISVQIVQKNGTLMMDGNYLFIITGYLSSYQLAKIKKVKEQKAPYTLTEIN